MGEVYFTTLFNDANLKAYYRLEGAMTADSKGANTLTNVGTVTLGTGKYSGCANFGGANNLRVNTDLTVTGGACSISLWAKMNAEIGSGVWNFASLSDGGTFTINYIGYEYNGGTRRVTFVRNKNNVGTDTAVKAATLGNTVWHHLVYTYNGVNIIGYVDGSASNTVAASGSGSGAASDWVSIGGAMGWDGATTTLNYANSLVDDVCFFNKALTSTEVGQIYNGTLLPRMGGSFLNNFV